MFPQKKSLGEVRFGISLLWILSSAFEVTAGKFCYDNSWKFHEATATCMKVVRDKKKSLFHANNYCKTLGQRNGHLVYMFDEDTDNFVKGLLQNGESAFIGLNYQSIGQYKWIDSNKSETIPYFGWEIEPHDKPNETSAVTITKNGWEDVSPDKELSFVCQVDYALDLPEMNCPAAEEMVERHTIGCSIDIPKTVYWTEYGFEKNGQLIALCRYPSCLDNKYNVYNKAGNTNTELFSPALNIKDVFRNDAGNWSCYIKFSSGYTRRSNPCSLTIYKMPKHITCASQFNENTIKVTCTTDLVYPKAVCSWNSQRDKIVHFNSTINKFTSGDGKHYYWTTCDAWATVRTAGVFQITVYMDQNVQGGQRTTQKTEVQVDRPSQPPKLYYFNKLVNEFLEVTENETVLLSCKVYGGSPLVYRTKLYCSQLSNMESSGQTVTMSILATQNLHDKHCNCHSDHITGTTENVWVTFRVRRPAAVTQFNVQDSRGQSKVVQGQRITISCWATGYPSPELELQKDGIVISQKERDHYIQFSMTASCSDMGEYLCVARNTINNTYSDSKRQGLSVFCPPQHCDPKAKDPSFGFPVDKDINITFCVVAYPHPSVFKLFKVKSGNLQNELNSSTFNASYVHTNEKNGEGEINLKITSFKKKDIGHYQLYVANTDQKWFNYLNFHLDAKGPPKCPTNFTAEKIYPNYVTLIWEPGFDGGLPQNFTVFTYDSSQRRTYVQENLQNIFSHNVTGLSESSTYMFGIEAENAKGRTECSSIHINVTTTAFSSSVNLQLMVPVIIGLILIILVAVLITTVVIRRQKSKGEKQVVPNKETKQTTIDEPSNSNIDDRRKELYANIESKEITSAKLVTKEKKPPEKHEQEEADTYAQVKKLDKKPKKGTKGKKSNGKNEQDQANNYTQVYKFNKKDKSDNAAATNNDDMGAYSNVTVVDITKSRGAGDPDNLYTNAAKTTNKLDKKKKENYSRTVTDDGLVYVSVDINKKTTNPEIFAGNKVAMKPTNARAAKTPTSSKDQSVEYISLDFTSPFGQK